MNATKQKLKVNFEIKHHGWIWLTLCYLGKELTIALSYARDSFGDIEKLLWLIRNDTYPNQIEIDEEGERTIISVEQVTLDIIQVKIRSWLNKDFIFVLEIDKGKFVQAFKLGITRPLADFKEKMIEKDWPLGSSLFMLNWKEL